MTHIAIITGSTRPGRKGEAVARWVLERARERSDATFELVDLAEHDLPHLDEPTPAAMGPDYTWEHTKQWAARIVAFDGFVFVTPEYNHSIPGVLKDALDYLYVEWHNKAAGCVAYGLDGGVRAVEQLRLILSELRIAHVRDQVALSMFDDFEDGNRLKPRQQHGKKLDTMLDDVIAWSNALATLRSGDSA